MPPEVLQRLTWNGTPTELGDFFVLHKNRRTARAQLLTHPVVMEQPDGTFIAWAGQGDAIGLDYVEDGPEHAQAAALFALNRKSGHATCSPRCTNWEMHTHQILTAFPDARLNDDDEE